jgi:hypothetical protein
MKTDKKPQQHTQDVIESLVKGPGAVLWIPKIHGEFLLARVEFGRDKQGKFMKWVGIHPSTGGDIHWTSYHRLGSHEHYNFLIDENDQAIGEVSTLEEAPYSEASALRLRLNKWRHLLTLHYNERNFNEFFENE